MNVSLQQASNEFQTAEFKNTNPQTTIAQPYRLQEQIPAPISFSGSRTPPEKAITNQYSSQDPLNKQFSQSKIQKFTDLIQQKEDQYLASYSVEQLQAKVYNLLNEIDQCRRQLLLHQDTIQEQNKMILDQKNLLEQAQISQSQQQKQMVHLQELLDQDARYQAGLQEQLAAAQNQIKGIQNNILETQEHQDNEAFQLALELEHVNKDKERFHQKYMQLETELAMARQKIQDQGEYIASFQAKVKQTNVEVASIQDTCNKQQYEIKANRQQAENSTNYIKKLEEDLLNQQKSNNELLTKFQFTQTQLEDVQLQNKDLTKKNEELQQNLQHQTNKNKVFKSKANDQDKFLKNKQNEIDQFAEQNKQLKKQVRQLQSVYQSTLEQLKEVQASRTQESEQLKATLNDNTKDIQSLKQQKILLLQDLQNREQEIKELALKLENAYIEIDQYSQLYKEREESLKNSTLEGIQLKQEIERLTLCISQMQSTEIQLRQQLEDKCQKIEFLTNSKMQVERELKDCQQYTNFDIQELEKLVEQIQLELERNKQQNYMLENQQELYKTRIKELEYACEQMSDHLQTQKQENIQIEQLLNDLNQKVEQIYKQHEEEMQTVRLGEIRSKTIHSRMNVSFNIDSR